MIKIGICDISKVYVLLKKLGCTLMDAKEKPIKVWSYLTYIIFIQIAKDILGLGSSCNLQVGNPLHMKGLEGKTKMDDFLGLEFLSHEKSHERAYGIQ